MANRLANENSPYLLQHQDNPVDWYPWGEEALEKARREDKPIFLSIGYAACHWCHVMAHESFEDPQTAALMNEHFVNIKVDREERADLDSIYMNAVVAMTGQGGWPMSVFLTPGGEPFFGGTYFPPVRRYNMPSFKEILLGVARTWEQDRQRLDEAGSQLAAQLQSPVTLVSPAAPLSPKVLDAALHRLEQTYDWQYGGWGRAPRFPQPMAIEFLLRQASAGNDNALRMATHVLDAMARGGMYDVVGGGFARYSTDDHWLVPHFEKMLYDNAQLATVYLHAHLLTGHPVYRRVCEETLDFMVRELMPAPGETGPRAGFFSSLDADSEGEEGKFYVWSLDEIRQEISNEKEAALLEAAFGLTPQGNFEGANVLQRALTDAEIAERFGIPPEEVPARLRILFDRLLAARSRRVRPGTDDKILVSWNALALVAFSEAARYLDRSDYLEVARQTADFLITELQPGDRLLRSWRNGKAQHNAYLEDYAGLALGLLALYQADPDPWWFQSALQLAGEMVAHFSDPAGGFFDTRDDHGPLITRPKDIQDGATPSGNSLAANALLLLSAYTGSGEWRDRAEQMLSAVQETAVRYPTAFSNWLCAVDAAVHPLLEVAILGDLQDPQARDLLQVYSARFRPHAILAASPYPPPPTVPPLLADRPLLDGAPTAYVCQNFACQRPVNTAAALQAQLDAAVSSITSDTGQ